MVELGLGDVIDVGDPPDGHRQDPALAAGSPLLVGQEGSTDGAGVEGSAEGEAGGVKDVVDAGRCRALLVQATPLRVPTVADEWVEAWRGSRPGDRHELFIVYHRK